MRFMMIWETDPQRMLELIRIETKDRSPIPKGIKFVPSLEWVTPGGLWITVVEADDPEPLFVWAQSMLHLFKDVRVEPILTFDEWLKTCPAIEERAKPMVEEEKR